MTSEATLAERASAVLCRASVLLCFAWALSASAAELPATAELLPPETLYLISIDSLRDFRDHFSRTDLFRFWKDPAMARFSKDAEEAFLGALEEDVLSRYLGRRPYPLPQGRVIFAAILLPAAADGESPSVANVFLCQWGSELQKAKDMLEARLENAEKQGATLKKQEYRGAVICSVLGAQAAGPNETDEEPGTDYSYCFIGDCLILSDQVDILKFVISRAAGKGGAVLAEDADYRAAMKRVGSGDLTFYIGLGRLWDKIKQQGKEDEAFIKATGLDRASCAAATMKIAPSQAGQIVIGGFVRTSGDRQGILRMLDMPPAPMAVPEWMPGDSCAVARANLDPIQLYEDFFRIANALEPEVAAAIDSPIVPPSPGGQPGVQLKKDVLTYLQPGIWLIDVPTSSSADRLAEILSLGAVPVSDRARLEKSLSRLHERLMGSDAAMRRNFLGHTVYLLSRQAGPMPDGEYRNGDEVPAAGRSEPSGPAFSVTSGYLLIGDVKLVEDAIRAMKEGSDPGLARAQWYRRAVESLPPAVGYASLVNLRTYAEYIWMLLRRDTRELSFLGDMADTIKDDFDVSHLPDFAAVRKYFGTAVFHFAGAADGFTFECRLLAAAEE